MLKKFNSHDYTENEATFQDRRSKKTGPAQNTATTTAEYSSIIRMLIETEGLEPYSSRQQLKV